ncbi:ribosome recycling factor [Candidatus Chlamydia sanziniae]|uniref:Ribosome-recycling factor n=1 Tax=Candidatus Chlamydia sanziniae TaxID=1806891 RepID=A0A1A9HUJ8_9CHLA|nr:ribosome recycling factor [Candidatus Chlamydia sanziniae]ANH78505.1 Ribosome recycling factor [Candidatus Chlamydia sanziniae]
MSTFQDTEKKMAVALDFFQKEIKSFRTGKAHSALVETVIVDVYGTTMRLLDIASISVADARQLMISPYDTNNASAIAKGIIAANLNLQPEIEGAVIRIKIPEPTADYRKEMVKQLRRKCEETKVNIRNIRRDANDKLKKDSTLTEDAVKNMEKKVQELTDKFCKQIDDFTKQKETEIASL